MIFETMDSPESVLSKVKPKYLTEELVQIFIPLQNTYNHGGYPAVGLAFHGSILK